jgi:Cys-tRNA(Pro)/Cys-tRNA(Cys) deacylase
MKKVFKTTIHESAKEFDSIIFSAGKIGYQVQVDVKDLEKVIRLEYGDLTKDSAE